MARSSPTSGVTRPSQLTGATIKRMLTNPTIAGLRVHRGEIVGRGNWEPILDEVTWRQVFTLVPLSVYPRSQPAQGHLITLLVVVERVARFLGGAPATKQSTVSCRPASIAGGLVHHSQQSRSPAITGQSARIAVGSRFSSGTGRLANSDSSRSCCPVTATRS